MKLLIFTLLVLLKGSCLGGVLKTERNNNTIFYEDCVPEELKVAFLRYQLVLGVEDENKVRPELPAPQTDDIKTPEGLNLTEESFRTLTELKPPEDFAKSWYQLVQHLTNFTMHQITEFARRSNYCPSSLERKCWDIGDAGSNCC